ncbi:MAG: DUF1704 domain-containing protein [Candidatus ainarchaeum sp.]|nr:DUF1704 domain-containing protein [Candidatus ainarchaeum sp.]
MNFVDYRGLDQKIGEISISTQLNILFYINPQNLLEEKKRFFEEIQKGNEYNPFFTYPSKNPLFSYFSMKPIFETYKQELKELLQSVGNDNLGLLCENKILDILESIELVKSIGTSNFDENSKQFYGSVDNKLLKLAKEQVEKEILPLKSEKVSFDTAITMIKNFLKNKKLNYKMEFRESAGSMFAVNSREGILYINKDLVFNKDLVKRFIAHEIETHIYRYENGFSQPYSMFSQGTSKNMLETEEGLAVNVELLKGLEVDNSLKQYAGRVLAIHYASKESFFQTFLKLKEFFSEEDAFTLTLRAKRGTFKTSEPGAFTKDMLYYRGMFLVQDFLKNHPIEDLYYGKYSVSDIHLVKGVDGLKKPKFLPDLPKI